MRKTLDQVIALMTTNGYPFWRLAEIQGNGIETPAGEYGGGDDAPEEGGTGKGKKKGTIEEGAAKLRSLVQAIGDDHTHFRIWISKTAYSHGNTVLGPYDFSVIPTAAHKPGEGHNLFAALSGSSQGLGSLGSLGEILSIERQRDQLAAQRNLLDGQLASIEREKEQLAKERAELKDERKRMREEAKADGLRDAKAELLPDQIRLQFDKEQIKDLKDKLKEELARAERGDDRTFSRLNRVLDILDVKLEKWLGGGAEAPALAGTPEGEDDPAVSLVGELADFVHGIGDIAFTQTVFDYARKLAGAARS